MLQKQQDHGINNEHFHVEMFTHILKKGRTATSAGF